MSFRSDPQARFQILLWHFYFHWFYHHTLVTYFAASLEIYNRCTFNIVSGAAKCFHANESTEITKRDRLNITLTYRLKLMLARRESHPLTTCFFSFFCYNTRKTEGISLRFLMRRNGQRHTFVACACWHACRNKTDVKPTGIKKCTAHSGCWGSYLGPRGGK